MLEEIEIQTVDEVKRIDYMKATNDTLSNTIDTQTTYLENISESLDNLTTYVDSSSDLSEVIDSIDSIDTTIVESQTEDILKIVNNQQQQIDSIQSDVQEIKDLINKLIEK